MQILLRHLHQTFGLRVLAFAATIDDASAHQ